ncbi:MAG: endonuclease domain-containing protein [Caldilineae bacterium]|nr:MAG: endonuclease domain-containing protein [Caldilineae bacterium]
MPKKHPLRAPEIIRRRAKALRKEMTPAEAALWQRLRNRQLHGLKFRRQHPIGRFIVDFYCAEKRLVVEIDGEIHETQREYDTVRDDNLRQRGYRVIRFHNREVLDDIERVLESIRQAALAAAPEAENGG